jgi:hypothetical protein
MPFDRGQPRTSSFRASSASFGAASTIAGTASKLGTAIGAATSVASAIRSVNLPTAGEAIGDIYSAVAMFGGDDAANDFRVRLSLPLWPSFRTSAVLKPLKEAGGLIFPYTPQINISSGATYQGVPTVHTNYTFQAYQKSDPGEIKITAPFFCEDATQALYWIATVHYLRSLTKMFSGNDPKAGNPPPMVFLNGYGAYVFKNVPVVVASMSVDLGTDVDYITTEVVGSAAGEIAGLADSLGGLADTLGGALPQLSGITSTIGNIAGGVGQIANLAGTFGIGGPTSGGLAYVPTKSSVSITLKPVYSRNSARNFSLDRFVSGGYMNNSVGYI